MKEFPFKVVLSGKTVAQASTLAEARTEAKRVGGIAMAGRGYAKRNPFEGPFPQKVDWDGADTFEAIIKLDDGQVIVAGKPEHPTFAAALQAVNGVLSSQIAAHRVRMIEVLAYKGKDYLGSQRWTQKGANEMHSVKNPRQRKLNQKDYTHYLVDVRTGKIASGWSYPEDAKEQQKELLTDFPSAKGAIKVVTKRGLNKFGCNPDDNGCWSDPVELQEVMAVHTAKRNPSDHVYKVILKGKVVAEATSEREAHKEALRVGGVVGKSALRNPSSGAKQRARGTRQKGQYPRNFDQSELGLSEAKAAREAIAGYIQRESVPMQEAWGTFSGPRVREAIPRERQRHAQGLKRAAKHRPQLPNPSEEVHIAEAKQYLTEAQGFAQSAKAAQRDGKAQRERMFWAQTLEYACICWANVDKVPTREATELRQEANRLRELAYKNLIG